MHYARQTSGDLVACKHDGKFDLGSAAHEIILSRGGGIDVHDFADWRTKDAKAARVASRKSGRTPMLTTQYERALKIAEAAWAHPHAVFDLDVGHPETVVVWSDIGGPLCRGMLDWWDGETVVTDVKTTDVPLTDASLARQISSLSYDLSAAFYVRGLVASWPCGPSWRAASSFVGCSWKRRRRSDAA